MDTCVFHMQCNGWWLWTRVLLWILSCFMISALHYFENDLIYKSFFCSGSINYLFIYLFIYVFMYLFIYLFIYVCINVLMYSCIYVFMYLCIYSFMYLFIHSISPSFIPSFIHLFIHSFLKGKFSSGTEF